MNMKTPFLTSLFAALSVALIASTALAQQPQQRQSLGDLFAPQLGPADQPAPGLNQFAPANGDPQNNAPRNNNLRNRGLGNGNPAQDPNGFDQSDPTQAPPDMRRILEGEQEQVRREPPPAIEVVGKVIGADGIGKALLRINERFVIVEKGTRFTIATGLEPLVFTVSLIDTKGVEIQGTGEGNQTRLLP